MPEAQFGELLFTLKPPPGTISSAPAPQSTRAGELLAWAEGPLGDGIPQVLSLVRTLISVLVPEKLTAFDEIFGTVTVPSTPEAQESCPYQGLDAFTPATAQFFYGRQETVDLLVQKLAQANVVPLIGASGSGKSSVVRAGLVPHLTAQGWRVLEPIKPGVKPMAALRRPCVSCLPSRRTGRWSTHWWRRWV